MAPNGSFGSIAATGRNGWKTDIARKSYSRHHAMMKLVVLVAGVLLAGCQTEVPEICKTHPPYDDAKYEQWRKKALEAGCDKIGAEQAAKADTA